MNSVDMILEGLWERNQLDAFEEARNRDFVSVTCRASDVTKETLMERVRQAHDIINSETRATAYCLGLLAEMEG